MSKEKVVKYAKIVDILGAKPHRNAYGYVTMIGAKIEIPDPYLIKDPKQEILHILQNRKRQIVEVFEKWEEKIKDV